MSKQKQKNDLAHYPVLIQEVLDNLRPQTGQSYLDLTAGYGGHAAAILELTNAPELATLVDRDGGAIAALKKRFSGTGAKILQSDFLSTLEMLASENQQFDMILADLGVSSPQLENSERGFSFSRRGPLDMRMDSNQSLNAEQIVNQSSEAELKDILAQYGEEPRAKAIAKAIVAHRPIEDTATLATTINSAAGRRARWGKINPATRSFQAIRIAVNNELEQLERSLPLMVKVLKPGGRLAIISFHSLEDRIVKQYLAEHSGQTYDAELSLLTKKPITASRSEIASNPRARSAKLRVVQQK